MFDSRFLAMLHSTCPWRSLVQVPSFTTFAIHLWAKGKVHQHHPIGDGICTEFQVMWNKIPSKSHQNLRRLKMCISHPQNGTFTNLWTMAVSEVIGNMLGNNYWLGTSLVILCNQQVVRWICLKNGEIIPLKHPYTYHRENVQTKPCLLSQGWQRWHMLTSLKSLKQTHPTEPLQLTHCKQSRRQSQSPSIKNE